MKTKLKKIIACVIIVSLLFSGTASAKKLTKKQRRAADYIAKVTSENWDTYGILPSVAVVQACNESSLGVHCRGNNLWGILSGAVTYPSLYDGIHGYLRVVNNTKYYKGVTFRKDYRKQLRRILDGGYCEPEGEYYNDCMTLYNHYNFDKYDEEMFEKQRREKIRKRRAIRKAKQEKKRLQQHKKTFKVIHDDTVPYNSAVVDTDIIKKGTVNIIHNNMMIGIYDVKNNESEEGRRVRINNPKLDGLEVKLDVHEEAVS